MLAVRSRLLCRALILAGFALAASPLYAAAASAPSKLPTATILPVEGAQAIAYLNHQRVANGIPAITTVNQDYASAWCPNEDAGASAGENARDWSGYTDWSLDASPWSHAPLHQISMYFPGFTAAGDVDAATATSTSTACMGLGAMADAPTSPMFYSFINEAGPSAVPTSETVNDEFPFAPQQVVGIPQGTPTGPQPILYALGMGYVHALSWSLKTAAGTPVSDVGFADYVSASAAGLDPTAFEYLFAGVMIPPPLAAGTTYRGSVTWQGDNNVTATQTFSFTTAPAHNFLYLSVVKHAQGAGKDTTFIVDTGAPDPTLTLHGPNGRTRTVSLQKANAGSYMNFVLLANGHWSATAQSGGGSSDYALSVQHQSFSVSH